MKYAYMSGTPNVQNGVARAGTPARLLGVASGLRRAGADVVFIFDDRRQFTSASSRPFDVHLVHSSNYGDTIWMAEYVQSLAPDIFVCSYPDVILTLGPYLSRAGVLVVYDIHDDDAKVAETLGESTDEIEAYKRTQHAAIAQADVLWVSTEHERALAEEAIGAPGRILFVPNGSSDELLNAECFAADGDLLFVGNGHYPPNARAVHELEKMARSALESMTATTKLRVVGQGYDDLARSSRIDIRGFVPDLAEGMRGTSIGLAPLLTGAGAKMKVRDYCAAGLPVLSTTEGALGLPACAGVLIEDDLAAWPSLIARLVGTPDRLAAMSFANRSMVSHQLSWRAIGAHANARMQGIERMPHQAPHGAVPLKPPRWIQDNVIVLLSEMGSAEPGHPVILARNT